MGITIEFINMRFFDREQEFEKLREIEALSHEVAQFTIITGRRRIGKTEMIKKFYEDKTMLYFFVARKAEADLCDIFIDEIRTKLNIPMLDSKGMSFSAIFPRCWWKKTVPFPRKSCPTICTFRPKVIPSGRKRSCLTPSVSLLSNNFQKFLCWF